MLRGMPLPGPFHRTAPVPGDDLGLGLKAGPRRGVNKDGTFNVRRVGAPLFRPYELYHQLIAMSLPRFIGVLLAGYLAANLFFGSLYTLVGLEHFAKASGAPMGFLDAFFFSAQTLTTVGYGHIYPIGTLSSVLAAVESLVGLLAFAVATGLLYGRFSRPHARILFSRQALVAPFRGGRAFMFRRGRPSSAATSSCRRR
jgi:inward rectifier potassium channel